MMSEVKQYIMEIRIFCLNFVTVVVSTNELIRKTYMQSNMNIHYHVKARMTAQSRK